jgi:hypothetical protein
MIIGCGSPFLLLVPLPPFLPLIVLLLCWPAALLFSTRLVVKRICFAIVTPLLKPANASADWDPARHYRTEIPVKFLVYAAVGINAFYTARVIYRWLGI